MKQKPWFLGERKTSPGVSLVITFLLMTIILAIVLSVNTIVFREVKSISAAGNSMASFYAAQTGVEEALYLLERRSGGRVCTLCAVCQGGDCQHCTYVSLVKNRNGCEASSCDNCQVSYDSSFDDKTYTVTVSVKPNPLISGKSLLTITSQGSYRDSSRTITVTP